MAFNNDGTKLYVLGNSPNKVSEYNVGSVENGVTVQSNNLNVLSDLTTIDQVILNSTLGTNLTSENLTAYPQGLSPGDARVIYDWRLNGSSIAIINMPFEGGSNSTFTKDYSSNANNGNVSGATYNATGGYDGKGAYEFDGTNDYIDASGATWSSAGGPVTVVFWNKVDTAQVQQSYGFSFGNQTSPNTFQTHAPWEDNFIYWDYGANAGAGRIKTNYTNYLDKWTHIAFVSEGNGGSFKAIYLDGILAESDSTSSDGPNITLNGLLIGAGPGLYHNGSIDEFMIYERVLSPEQISALYNNRTDLIVSNETSIGDIWSVSATPNDGTSDGAAVSSNNLTVLADSAPSVFGLVPTSGTNFNVSQTIEIGANVTDDVAVDTVLANVTLPNGTINQLTLTNTSNFYNNSFTIPFKLVGDWSGTKVLLVPLSKS